MIELNVEQQLLPVITTNFEVVKASLTESIAKYKNMIVTEEGLKGCKADQKKLAGMRNKIDDYRKSVKSELLVPITKFEDNCKVLTGLILDAETPLKAGIEVFNEKIRKEKRISAELAISEAITQHKLTIKYANQLTVLDKYTMLSTKSKDTKIDVDQRAFILLQEQIREIEALRAEEERKVEALRLETERKAELAALEEKRQNELAAVELKRKQDFEAAEIIRKAENIEIAKNAIEQANEMVKEQMQLEDFTALIESGANAMTIIQEINKRKNRIIRQETPVIVPEKIIPIVKNTPIPEEKAIELPFTEVPPEEKQPVPLKKYFIEMRTTGTLQEIKDLSQFLRDNNYEYDVIAKGELE